MDKTVFVIGAGANTEIGFPDGNGLKALIADSLNIRFDGFGRRIESGDYVVTEALKIFHTVNGDLDTDAFSETLRQACWYIRDTIPTLESIDNLIDRQADNEMVSVCGKLAIVKNILKAEKEGELRFSGSDGPSGVLDYTALEGTWYIPFFQNITNGCSENHLVERFKKITLVIFNYDRAVEHFLFCHLKQVYRLDDNSAAEIIGALTIFHPYGMTGSLPWMNEENPIKYGSDCNAHNLIEISQQIKTFSERQQHESEYHQIKVSLGSARRLVFMGFGFYQPNMRLIAPAELRGGKVTCYACTVGLSTDDIESIESGLQTDYEKNIIFKHSGQNIYCKNFFDYFKMGLSFDPPAAEL